MSFLGFVIGGVILGYLIGSQIGETRAGADFGWLAIFVVDSFKEHYAGQGALVGGIIGGVFGLYTS